MTRVYTAGLDGRCTVCQLTEAEHAPEAWTADARACPPEVTAENVTDEIFLEFSRTLLEEMKTLDGRQWQDAQDLRDDCRSGRVHNDFSSRTRVAVAINARAKGVR